MVFFVYSPFKILHYYILYSWTNAALFESWHKDGLAIQKSNHYNFWYRGVVDMGFVQNAHVFGVFFPENYIN